MNFDLKGLSAEHQGKRSRIEFTDGEIREGDLAMLCRCDEHASCCGIVFDLWTTSQPAKYTAAFEKSAHPAVWSEIEFVKSFEVLEKEAA
jgi:hypothetical protein